MNDIFIKLGYKCKNKDELDKLFNDSLHILENPENIYKFIYLYRIKLYKIDIKFFEKIREYINNVDNFREILKSFDNYGNNLISHLASYKLLDMELLQYLISYIEISNLQLLNNNGENCLVVFVKYNWISKTNLNILKYLLKFGINQQQLTFDIKNLNFYLKNRWDITLNNILNKSSTH